MGIMPEEKAGNYLPLDIQTRLSCCQRRGSSGWSVKKICRNLRFYSLDDLRKQGKAWMDRYNSTPRMALRLRSPNQAELDGLKRIMKNTGEVRCLRLLKCLTSDDN